VQHAATNRAIVELGTENGSLTVEIIDHGPGYDGQETPGSGILGLRDRLQSVGGDLHLESPPGEGTTLRAVLLMTHRREGTSSRLDLPISRVDHGHHAARLVPPSSKKAPLRHVVHGFPRDRKVEISPHPLH
jgi:hypothetical protein